jgi:hypothetical protein
MLKKIQIRLVVLMMALLAAACGGSKGGQSGAGASGTTEASGYEEVEADLSAMDQLKAISTDLQGQLDALMAPINEVDKMVDYVGGIPERLGIDAGSLLASARSTMETGQISLSVDLTSDAAVRAEIENVFLRLQWIVAGLKAMPQNAQALTVKAGEAVVKLPVLAGKVTAEANVKVANPFAKPEAKAQAQADLQSLAQVQADVQGAIQQVQQQIMGLPTLATSALAKLTASFAGSAHAGKKKGKGGKKG